MRIDHAILATGDLEGAGRRLTDATGLAVVAGGVHPAWGTRNAIVPLGGAYLELVGIEDPTVARGSAFGRLVAEAAAGDDDLRLVGWAVEPGDFDAATRAAGVDAVRGQRARPDGSMLSWSMAGADEALPRGLPFFLRWDAPQANPARAAVAHRPGVAPAGIAWIEVPDTTAAALDAWLGGADHGLDVRPAGPLGAPLRVAVAQDGAGEIVVPAP